MQKIISRVLPIGRVLSRGRDAWVFWGTVILALLVGVGVPS